MAVGTKVLLVALLLYASTAPLFAGSPPAPGAPCSGEILNSSGVWSRLGTADYYVDPVNGNDSTGTGGQSAPFKSLAKLAALSVPSTAQVLWKTYDGSWIPAPPWTGIAAQYDFVQGADPTVLYDLSGNGNNGALGTGRAKPTWTSSGLQFAGGQTVSVPGLTGLTTRSFASAVRYTGSGGLNVFVSAGSASFDEYYSGYVSNESYSANKTIYDITTEGPTLNSSVIYVSSRGTNSYSTYCNGIKGYLPVAGTPPASGPFTIGSLGGSFYFTGVYHQLIVYNRSLSDSDYAVLHSFFALSEAAKNRGVTFSAYNKHPAGFIVFDGDSLTNGTNASSVSTSYPSHLVNSLMGGAFDFVNYGIGGQTTTGIVGRASGKIDSKYSLLHSKHLYVLWVGINDLALGASPTTIFNNIRTICLARKAAGYKVIVLTVTTKGSPPAGFETARATLNANIRANCASFADGLVDVAANTVFGDPADTTCFADDQTHFTDTGYAIVADMLYPVALPLMAP